MRHDTNSPVEEARACITGVGTSGLPEESEGLAAWRRVLVASYVVKKAPAGTHQLMLGESSMVLAASEMEACSLRFVRIDSYRMGE